MLCYNVNYMNDNTANNTANNNTVSNTVNNTADNKEINKANKEQGKTYYKIVQVTPRKYWLDKQEDPKDKLRLGDLKEYITNSDEYLKRFDEYDKISSELKSKEEELNAAKEKLKEIEKLKKDLEELKKEKEELENKEITFEDLSDEYKTKFIEILKYSDYNCDVNEGLNDVYFLDTNNILNEQKGLINNENKYDYKYHYRLVDNNNRKYDFDNINKDKGLNNLINTRLVIEATPNLVN